MTPRIPVVLVVDDEPRRVALNQQREDVKVLPVHPQDLVERDIREADLILVDHALDHWTWDEPPPFACRPSDGVAVAGIIRAHLRRLDCPPAALALYSGALERLAPDVQPREHLIAMAFGLEWAFDKKQRSDTPDLDSQVEILARAVCGLPRSWSQDDPDGLVTQLSVLLGISGKPWEARAFGEVERCRPPMHQLSNWTDGLAIVRWLLHRIIPYPCCLLGVTELSLRLRVKPDWLQAHLRKDQKLYAALQDARYQGVLAHFLGVRWWWAGWEHTMRTSLHTLPTSIKEIHAWLERIAESPVEKLDVAQPVLAYDAEAAIASIAPMRDCVRIQPDMWPGYADEPWCLKRAARDNARLRSLVLATDLEAVEEG